MNRQKEIVVCGREDILSQSIEYFLSEHEGWNVDSLAFQEDTDEISRAIEALQPDFLIIHEKCYLDRPKFPFQLLRNHPGMLLILLSLENNLMEVYSKQDICVKDVSDLISLIENK